ncbi:MAG: aminoacyl-tRNA hydrolase [Patescibacteria group bacterium]
MIDKITIIVGLGNPGKDYTATYHNVGQQFLSSLPYERKAARSQPLFISEEMVVENERQKLYFIWPKTFMNESGKAVKAILKHFHTTPDSLLIAHDDFDIPLGEFRVIKNRGSAGHHGIDSIMHELKTKDFLRIRIGVRTSKEKAGELALKKISVKDKKILQGVFEELREKVIEKT